MSDSDQQPSGLSPSNNQRQKRKELLSQAGAICLAKRLERYWHGKGYRAARFWAEPIGERFPKVGTYDFYRVNCNLVNALPPRYRDE